MRGNGSVRKGKPGRGSCGSRASRVALDMLVPRIYPLAAALRKAAVRRGFPAY
jgi:hypothetical protein